jgi:hypothetical protein
MVRQAAPTTFATSPKGRRNLGITLVGGMAVECKYTALTFLTKGFTKNRRNSQFNANRQKEGKMPKELLLINQKISLNSGSGGIDQSFHNIPNDKYALIELFSYRLKEQDNTEDLPEPLILWAYPADQGPPRTKTVFFPIRKTVSGSPFSAETYTIKFHLEPGDAWGVSLYRQNTDGNSELDINISGYYYPATH